MTYLDIYITIKMLIHIIFKIFKNVTVLKVKKEILLKIKLNFIILINFFPLCSAKWFPYTYGIFNFLKVVLKMY